MSMNLNDELDRLVRFQIERGRYATESEVLEVVRAWLKERDRKQSIAEMGSSAKEHDPTSIIGCMRDDAEWIDEMTREIMRDREARWTGSSKDE